MKNIRGYEEKQLESLNERDDFNNNLVNGNELIADYKKSFRTGDHIIGKSDPYFDLAETEQEIITKEQIIHSISLGDSTPVIYSSRTKVEKPQNGDKETFSGVDSYTYPERQPDSNKESVSVDQLGVEKEVPGIGSVGKTLETEEGNRAKKSLRRSSSLSSIPVCFYPDPYSIVFSRYLEDLGSLTSYSSASGSEATEYLQISQVTTPELPDTGHSQQIEYVKKQARGESESQGETESSDFYNMNFDSALSTSEEYQGFRSSVPLRKICVEADGSKVCILTYGSFLCQLPMFSNFH